MSDIGSDYSITSSALASNRGGTSILPTIYQYPEFAAGGGLMSYGGNPSPAALLRPSGEQPLDAIQHELVVVRPLQRRPTSHSSVASRTVRSGVPASSIFISGRTERAHWGEVSCTGVIPATTATTA